MQFDFKCEELTDSLWNEIIEFDSKWWAESPVQKDLGIQYNPDKESYQQLNKCGFIKVFTGRDKETGKLVSVLVGSLTPYFQNKEYKTFDAIIFVLSKDKVYKGLLETFISYIKEYMYLDTDIMNIGFPEYIGSRPGMKKIMSKLGFTPNTTTYHKRIN